MCGTFYGPLEAIITPSLRDVALVLVVNSNLRGAC